MGSEAQLLWRHPGECDFNRAGGEGKRSQNMYSLQSEREAEKGGLSDSGFISGF